MKRLNWAVFTNRERNEAINDLKEIVSSSGGCILNAHFFSDLAMSLTVEVEECDIEMLHQNIAAVMTVSPLEWEKVEQHLNRDWWIFLNVTFIQGKGQLEIEVPEA